MTVSPALANPDATKHFPPFRCPLAVQPLKQAFFHHNRSGSHPEERGSFDFQIPFGPSGQNKGKTTTDFQTHTIKSAPEASKPQLEHSQTTYGFVPNLHAAMAESSALLGYTNATVLEVIVGTAYKMLSNYTNHIAETPLDDAFAKNEWHANAATT
ncbi:hypothetical protein [Rhodopirellula bahusiensis]|uniref:hypothetical protein n=1 Tax=Rhodopirellula bahusiensis TaxID=2014065 RepID=UPI003263EED9